MSSAQQKRLMLKYKGRTGGTQTGKRAAAAQNQVRHQRLMRTYIPRQLRAPTYARSSGANLDAKGVDIPNLSSQIGTPLLASVSTNGGCAVLNCVQPGNGSWNRVGRRIKMQSLRLRGAVETLSDNAGGAAATRGALIRLVVVYDKNVSGTPGTIPLFNQIFGTTDQLGNETGAVFDALRWDNTGRFRVLRDMTFNTNPNSIPAAAEEGAVNKQAFDEFIDLKGLETVFSGQSNPCTIADISSGALYLYARMDVATTNSVSILITESNSRLRYTD